MPAGTGAPGARSPLVLWGTTILIVLAIAFVAFLFVAQIVLRPQDPTPTPTAGSNTNQTSGASTSASRIAFVRVPADGGPRNLYVVNADGTNQQQVTEGYDINGTPAWSPDGKSILIQTDIDKVTTIVRLTIGPDNKMADSAQLTADIKADSVLATWSPDGSMIAFQSKQDGPLSQIYVMNTDGSNKRRVSDGNGFAGQPAWSPDSKMVTYVSGAEQVAGAEREVYIAPVDGGTPTQVSSIGGSLTNPIWSPDGKTIACLQVLGDRDYKLLLMNTDGANLRTLDEGLVIRAPSFSPAGDAIVYYTVSDVNNNINIYDLTTDRNLSVTKSQGDNYNPVWSPDGSMIAWASTPGNSPHKIAIANRDGTNRQTVSSGDGDDSQVAWGVVK